MNKRDFYGQSNCYYYIFANKIVCSLKIKTIKALHFRHHLHNRFFLPPDVLLVILLCFSQADSSILYSRQSSEKHGTLETREPRVETRDCSLECHAGVCFSCSESVVSNACNSSSLEDCHFRDCYFNRACHSVCACYACRIPMGNVAELCARRICAYFCFHVDI